MRHLKLLLVFSLVLYFSCEKEFNVVFSEIQISSQNDDIVQINIPIAEGNNTISNKINSGIEHNIIASIQIGESDNIESKTITESINAFVKEYETLQQEFPESPQVWEAQIDGEILYQSNDIISVSITSYTNTGGAHGILKISFLNFNAKNGNLIPNKALFKDLNAFKKLAEPYYIAAIEDKEILINKDQFNLPANIAYTEEGIVFLYNTYEIAAYSQGVIEFKVPFNEAQPYLVFNNF
ncbi:DUF3298 and DUF4163 domain-containing protein [Tamlana sp. I1]|uniref:DUF3298 and DUF4163 domain-containing protein n=1 Tax=Tamlana sp. I1 TaxID=2762061 RepID=UPI00188FF418|nr:DUF3298 and DUF4163 domain-containing protein [Tamlana sp. I1]